MTESVPELEFKVSLTRPVQLDSGVPPEEAIKMSERKLAKLRQKEFKDSEAAQIIPEILESIATTPVKITVSKSGSAHTIEVNDYK